jgi:hypothetical protein
LPDNGRQDSDKKESQRLETALQVHHQKGNGNSRFSARGQLSHDPSQTEPPLALAKLAFDSIANLGIGLSLPVHLGLSTGLRSPQGRPTEANTASLAPIAIDPGAIDRVGMD